MAYIYFTILERLRFKLLFIALKRETRHLVKFSSAFHTCDQNVIHMSKLSLVKSSNGMSLYNYDLFHWNDRTSVIYVVKCTYVYHKTYTTVMTIL